MSGDRACLSAYQKPPVSKSVEVTGPVLNSKILEPSPDSAMRTRDAIIGVVACAFRDGVQIEVILHIRADAGQVVDHVNASRTKRVGWPNARQVASSRGEPIAPQLMMTSRSAFNVSVPVPEATVTPTARPF